MGNLILFSKAKPMLYDALYGLRSETNIIREIEQSFIDKIDFLCFQDMPRVAVECNYNSVCEAINRLGYCDATKVCYLSALAQATKNFRGIVTRHYKELLLEENKRRVEQLEDFKHLG